LVTGSRQLLLRRQLVLQGGGLRPEATLKRVVPSVVRVERSGSAPARHPAVRGEVQPRSITEAHDRLAAVPARPVVFLHGRTGAVLEVRDYVICSSRWVFVNEPTRRYRAGPEHFAQNRIHAEVHHCLSA
jgi:hypothetical protein